MGTLTPVKIHGEDVYPTDAIGDRLREQLEAAPAADVAIPVKTIWCADTDEAKETLRRLLAALGQPMDGDRAVDIDGPGSAISVSFKEELTPPNSLRRALKANRRQTHSYPDCAMVCQESQAPS